MQTDQYNDAPLPGSVLVCSFTSHEEAAAYRIPTDLPAGDVTRPSWVMVDKLTAIRRERRGAKITRATEQQLRAVEAAMADLLGLVVPL